MQKHNTSRLYRVSELDSEKLRFKLTQEQLARVPRGEQIVFRKSTQPYKGKGYKHLLSRAEYNGVSPKTGKRRARCAATHLLGIIWDDDPEWVYETDLTKSSIVERRREACANTLKPSRLTVGTMSTIFEELIGFEKNVVIVKKVPIPVFLSVALICALRGTSDATSVANYWNNNIPFLSKIYPELTFKEISHDSVTRIYNSLDKEAVAEMLTMSYRWAQGFAPTEHEQRHYAVDGQVCRSSCFYPDGKKNDEAMEVIGRQIMTLNAVDVTNGKLCAGHTLIDTKSTEPKYASKLLSQFNIHGATVTFDALSTTVEVAQAVLDRGGYYLLAVKENQPKLFEAVQQLVEKTRKNEEVLKNDRGHDRIETRCYIVVPASGLSDELLEKWPGLREGCVVKATTRSFRRKNNVWTTSEETRWFITCHPYGGGAIAPWLAECIRGHWGVESFHWTMDMIWRQDWMQCQHPTYLNTREALAKMACNLVRAFQAIDQQKRGLKKPRSLTQLTHEVGSSLEVGLRWLQKLDFCKKSDAPSR